MGACQLWKPEEIEYLQKHYFDEAVSVQAIATHLGRSCCAVQNKATKLGLYKRQTHYSRVWTAADDWYLKTHIKPPYCYSNRQIAEDLGRTQAGVEQRLKKLRSLGDEEMPPAKKRGQPRLKTMAELGFEKQMLKDELLVFIERQKPQPDDLNHFLARLEEKAQSPNWLMRACNRSVSVLWSDLMSEAA